MAANVWPPSGDRVRFHNSNSTPDRWRRGRRNTRVVPRQTRAAGSGGLSALRQPPYDQEITMGIPIPSMLFTPPLPAFGDRARAQRIACRAIFGSISQLVVIIRQLEHHPLSDSTRISAARSRQCFESLMPWRVMIASHYRLRRERNLSLGHRRPGFCCRVLCR